MATVNLYTDEIGTVCEKVVHLADNTIIQTGLVLLLALTAVWLSIKSRIFSTQFTLNLRLTAIYDPPLYRKVLSREHSS